MFVFPFCFEFADSRNNKLLFALMIHLMYVKGTSFPVLCNAMALPFTFRVVFCLYFEIITSILWSELINCDPNHLVSRNREISNFYFFLTIPNMKTKPRWKNKLLILIVYWREEEGEEKTNFLMTFWKCDFLPLTFFDT